MHRDISKFIPTKEDRLTIRKWKNRLGIFHGLALLFLVSFVAVQNYATGMPHNAAADTMRAQMVNR